MFVRSCGCWLVWNNWKFSFVSFRFVLVCCWFRLCVLVSCRKVFSCRLFGSICVIRVIGNRLREKVMICFMV